MPDAAARYCRRCGGVVRVSASLYDVFEQMHYVCFHYQFEHGHGRDHERDPDEDCGLIGCPTGMLPVATPGDDGQEVVGQIVELLRDPASAEGWCVDMERPGVIRLRRPGSDLWVVVTARPPETD